MIRRASLLLAALTLAAPAVFAITVAEGPDFSNTPPGTAYTLTLGANTFSGTVATGAGADGQDNFQVTVPAGLRITGVSKTVTGGSFSGFVTFNTNESLTGPGTANFTTGFPLPVGTYPVTVATDFSTGSSWSITVTTGAAPNYTVTTSAGSITVTDDSGNGDTLDVTQPAANQIKFAAAGRTFSVNGGAPINGDSGNLSLTGVNFVNINTNAGNDTINVGAFAGTTFPYLTISGGADDDTVNLNGDITFASGNGLDVSAETLNVSANANVIASGTGEIYVSCRRNVSLSTGASLETVNGDLTVQANQQTTAMTGNFTGVSLSGAGTMIRATGSGVVTVKGRGGNDAGGFQKGVDIFGGAKIVGGVGAVDVTGTGGASANWINRGVTVDGAGSAITSTGGNVLVTGTGGALSSAYGIGVSLLNGGSITSDSSTGFVHITGTGSGSAGSDSNEGVELGAGSISTQSILITGIAGPGASSGLLMSNSSAITAPVALGNITVDSDSVSIDATSGISTSHPSGNVQFRPVAATHIDLGGAAAAGTLGLSDAVLDRVTTTTLIVSGGVPGADITISAPITRSSATNLYLYALGGGLRAPFIGTDLSLNGGALFFNGPLACAITGPSQNTGYPVLRVEGGVTVNVNGTSFGLDLTGTTYAGAAGDTFTIIDNDGPDATNGIFATLPEGATLAWPGSPALQAKISYTGGDGNDVVLTLFDPLVVTTVASDTSPGSLRGALAFAAANPGADTITFAPGLSGQTITLASDIIIGNTAPVTIDASTLAGGVTIDGNNATRIFTLNSGANLTLNALTLARGNGSGGNGGAISNTVGTLTLANCTLANNSAPQGGAIFSSTSDVGNPVTSSTTLTHCTLAGNTATSAGGAIHNFNGWTTLTHCTVSGNTAPAGYGGGAGTYGDSLTRTEVQHTIISGNTGSDVYSVTAAANSFSSFGHNLIGTGNAIGDFPTPANIVSGAPLLAPLGNYGGPTKTMALLPGSPARNAAAGSAITSDQRGFPIVGTPDIGAYEAGTPRSYGTWVLENLPTSATPTQRAGDFDFDGDGRINTIEYGTLTDPTAPATGVVLAFTRDAAGTLATVVMPYRFSASDITYTIERSTTLFAWTPIVTVNSADNTYSVLVSGVTFTAFDGVSVTFTDTFISGQLQVFYRLKMNVSGP